MVGIGISFPCALLLFLHLTWGNHIHIDLYRFITRRRMKKQGPCPPTRKCDHNIYIHLIFKIGIFVVKQQIFGEAFPTLKPMRAIKTQSQMVLCWLFLLCQVQPDANHGKLFIGFCKHFWKCHCSFVCFCHNYFWRYESLWCCLPGTVGHIWCWRIPHKFSQCNEYPNRGFLQ